MILFLKIKHSFFVFYYYILQDDIWLQGIQINEAKDVVVNIDREKKNAKLIDMSFIGNTVPDNDEPKSTGVVMTELNSSLDILNSTFKWNGASGIYSRGSLLIHNSHFRGNRGSKVRRLC